MSGEQRARILVVDDDRDLCGTIAGGLRVLGYDVETAHNVPAAMAIVRRHAFDAVLTDLAMPGATGHELVDFLGSFDARIPVIVLSGTGTMQDVIQVMRHGRAVDYLRKPLANFHALTEAIERALARRLAEEESPPAPAAPTDYEIERLSPREREVLGLLAEGLDNRDIAERLSLSERTVRNVLSRLYGKLGVGNRTQAVLRYNGKLAGGT